MSELATHRQIIDALRKAGGRGTLGDLMAATSLSAGVIESQILPALNAVGGHLSVDDNGELIYSVQTTRKLPADPWILRFGRAAREVFKLVFFGALSVVLVGYFVFYILVAIAVMVAAIAAASQGGDSDCDCDCDCNAGNSSCRGCDGCVVCCDANACNGCGDTTASCFTCGGAEARARKRQRNQERRAGNRERRGLERKERSQRRAKRTRRRDQQLASLRQGLGFTPKPAYQGLALEQEVVHEKPPFLRAVRDFIFGPAPTPPDPLATERNFLAYIRAHDGRVTAADAVMLTGLSLDAADAVLLNIATRFAGDVEVTEDGCILYTFDRLLVSTQADAGVLGWIASQGNAVTVEAFARHENIDAAQALARLQHLAAATGGKVEHGATTRFVFSPDAAQRADDLAIAAGTERTWTYCWDELERSPAIVGLPQDGRGWVVGFNVTNLILGSILLGGLETFADLLGMNVSSTAAWLLGYVPLAFSVSVFLIPFTRWIVRGFANKKRRQRNAHKVLLLALFHTLEGDDAIVTADELSTTIFGQPDFNQRAHLDEELKRCAVELDGTIDIGDRDDIAAMGGAADPAIGDQTVFRFDKVWSELHAVHHARLEVDLDALALTTVVYDSADDSMM